jgi:hypothetical protein
MRSTRALIASILAVVFLFSGFRAQAQVQGGGPTRNFGASLTLSGPAANTLCTYRTDVQSTSGDYEYDWSWPSSTVLVTYYQNGQPVQYGSAPALPIAQATLLAPFVSNFYTIQTQNINLDASVRAYTGAWTYADVRIQTTYSYSMFNVVPGLSAAGQKTIYSNIVRIYR